MTIQAQTMPAVRVPEWLARRPEQSISSEKRFYRIGRGAVDVYARLMLDLDIEWQAALPEGPKVIAANHPTTTDPFLLMLLEPDQMSILITETAFRVPVFGRLTRLAGHIPVIEGRGRSAFDEARQVLARGETIGIFPEGTLSPEHGGVHAPHTGAVRLALAAGAPIIPVGMALERERVRKIDAEIADNAEVVRWYFRGRYAMTVGPAMHLTGDVEDREYVRATSEHVMRRIYELSKAGERRVEKAGVRGQGVGVGWVGG